MIKALMIACVALSGCAGLQTRLPVPDAESLSAEVSTQEKLAFSRYETMLTRLDRISTEILQANVELCEKTKPGIGIRTHAKKTYSKHLRSAAGRWLGATDTPSVILVSANSPASLAGIIKSDILLNTKDKPVHARNKYVLGDDNTVRVRRGEDVLVLTLEPRTRCGYPVYLRMSGAINAYATGRSIIVTTAMMDFAATDEELALVVGHELAHNTMGHVPKILRNMILSGFATRTTRPFEAEADYVGLYYMARAGYDMEGVEAFWRRLGVQHPKNIVRAKTHPITPSRLLSIRLTAQEIENKRSADQPLVPNILSKTLNSNP